MRWEGFPSPDARWLAYADKDQKLWLYDTKSKESKLIAQSIVRFLRSALVTRQSMARLCGSGRQHFLPNQAAERENRRHSSHTSDRYNSFNPIWSKDGKWLYFFSDRMLKTTIGSPWGPRQPDPNFDRSMKLYELALTPGLRSPFAPVDELHLDKPGKSDDKEEGDGKPEEQATSENGSSEGPKKDESKSAKKKSPPVVDIDFADLAFRLEEVPLPPGNYSSLQATQKRLCWLQRNEEMPPKEALQCLDIANKADPRRLCLPT